MMRDLYLVRAYMGSESRLDSPWHFVWAGGYRQAAQAFVERFNFREDSNKVEVKGQLSEEAGQIFALRKKTIVKWEVLE